MDANRRRLLKLAAASAGVGLAASPLWARQCPPPGAAKPAQLLIDVHCHIFNSDDLPVRGFANHIVWRTSGRGWLNVGNWLSQSLDWLGQLSAPGIRTETKALEAIILNGEDMYERYCRVERPHGGILASATNYRLHNALALMELYPETDLFVPAMVDMDAHLDDRSPVTPRQQIDLMEYIFVITGGRFHGYVAFDPLRQVRYNEERPNDGETPLSPLNIVKRAVMEQGFVGVKLYPPMGFRPIGNDALANCQGIPRLASKYDAVLRRLFDWCAQERVPLITHCNDSNHADVYDDADSPCQQLGTPGQWAELLKKYADKPGRLKVGLGHFGRMDLHSRVWLRLQRARKENWPDLAKLEGVHQTNGIEAGEFLDALKAHPDALFADLSNYATLGDDELREDFRPKIAELMSAKGLGRQLMYGTDWFMTSQGGDSYLANMRKTLPASDYPAFYGGNAARFLGLARGERTRLRLEAFYRKWGLPDAEWMARVDRLAA
jgi:predicted TIM-barrel fold metal-dependent hydrolase